MTFRRKILHSARIPSSSGEYLRLKLMLDGLAVGVAVGLVITAYRLGITHVGSLLRSFLLAARENPALIALYVALMALMGLGAALCLRREGLISGSGIPQVAAQLAGRLRARWQTVLPLKFLGGILTLGGGLTLGREGPSVQVGAAVGQAFGELTGRPLRERRFLISCGGAAGLASAFNAPIAGLVFALEELHRNFSPVVLVSATTAAFAGALTASGAAFGLHPVLKAGPVGFLLRHYGLLLTLGLLTGLSGVLFNVCILRGKALCERLLPRGQRRWLWRGLIPFAVVAVVCLVCPDLFGSGEPFIFLAQNAVPGLSRVLALYAAKLALLALCFGSGLPGGIFFPLLVLGSLVGVAVGQAACQLGFLEPAYVQALALVAMAGHFSAIVRSPLTGILLVSEMTGSFTYLLPLGIVAMTAYGVAECCRSEPIYASLQRLLPLTPPDGHRAVTVARERLALELGIDPR